jgi:hypothetical protein
VLERAATLPGLAATKTHELIGSLSAETADLPGIAAAAHTEALRPQGETATTTRAVVAVDTVEVTRAPGRSRAEVEQELKSYVGLVRRCRTLTAGADDGTVLRMALRISGEGNVHGAHATGGFEGTPAGACAARIITNARFRAVSGTDVLVEYTYPLY